ncbi:MAG: gamma-glutamyltransferase [Cyclobacteriaceae bacterium]
MKNHLTLLLFLLFIGCTSQNSDEPSKETSTYGVVSAASPEASHAAAAIMEKGGNAIDAAIAASFTLGVTEPAMSGLGGGTQILLALPGAKPVAINGATISPALTPTDAVKEDLTYHRRSTIPSTVKVLGYVFEKYGSGNVSWEELLAPSIGYATNGFAIGAFRHKVYKQYQSSLQKSPHNTHYFLLPDGKIPAPGDTLKQPVLAQTLQRLAVAGADDFYSGEIAEEIARNMKEAGGWITLEDLNSFPDPEEMEPVHTTFRGFEVYSQPPPCGGWTVMLILNLLEQYPEDELQPDTQSRFENVLTALHLGHNDRKQNPVISEEDLNKRISKEYAKNLLRDYQTASNISQAEEPEGETTHFSVVDKDGMAVAVTASINAYFGAAAASPSLGFLYNTYMNDFEIGKPDHLFAIGPGKMNYSSMSPTIVQKGEESQLVIGSPGSARIISSVAQLVQLWVDTNLSIEQIVASPRVHSVNGKIYYEDFDTPIEWILPFRNKNFEVAFPSYSLMTNGLNAYFGGIHTVSLENGIWRGASDPRRDGETFTTN